MVGELRGTRSAAVLDVSKKSALAKKLKRTILIVEPSEAPAIDPRRSVEEAFEYLEKFQPEPATLKAALN